MARLPVNIITANLDNLAINGGLDLWQRITSSVRSMTNSTFYTNADRIKAYNNGPDAFAFSIERSSNVPTRAESGFSASWSSLSTTTSDFPTLTGGALASPFAYRMEGVDYVNIHGEAITVSFWFRASLTGNYAITLNGKNDFSRGYATTFNVPVAGTWQYVSKVIQLENLSGYNFDTNSALEINIASLSGSTYTAPTADTWGSGPYYGLAGCVNWIATLGATTQIAMFSITKGSTRGAFRRRGKSLQEEIILCQRYFQKSYELEQSPGAPDNRGMIWWYSDSLNTSVHTMHSSYKFPVIMRTDPTVHTYQTSTGAIDTAAVATGPVSSSIFEVAPTGFRVVATSGSSAVRTLNYHYTADAEL